MEIAKLLILQVIAHLLSDFLLQPQSWCDRKESMVFSRIHVYHAGIVFLTSYLLSFDPGFWKGALLITVTHFLIDLLKSRLTIRFKARHLFFFIDQSFHILIIGVVVLLYSNYYHIRFLLEVDTKVLSVIAGFLLCSKPANILINHIMNAFSIQTPDVGIVSGNGENGLPRAGRLIGISERYMALALIILGQFGAVGLIIASKSILRFNAPEKSEYVLVGTLLSFVIALFTGIIISLI